MPVISTCVESLLLCPASAGIGRTGTFIGLDMIIDYIRDFNARHNSSADAKAADAMSDAAGAP